MLHHTIRYYAWCNRGYLGEYESKAEVLKYIDFMMDLGNEWVTDGLWIEKVTTERVVTHVR